MRPAALLLAVLLAAPPPAQAAAAVRAASAARSSPATGTAAVPALRAPLASPTFGLGTAYAPSSLSAPTSAPRASVSPSALRPASPAPVSASSLALPAPRSVSAAAALNAPGPSPSPLLSTPSLSPQGREGKRAPAGSARRAGPQTLRAAAGAAVGAGLGAAGLDRFFDGRSARRSSGGRARETAADADAGGMDITEALSDGAIDSAAEEAPEELLDLWYSGRAKSRLNRSQIFTSIRLIKNSRGSEWYWKKYKAGALVRIKVHGNSLFFTRVENAATRKISSLRRGDFAGYFPEDIVYGKEDGRYALSLAQLKEKLVDALTAKAERSPDRPVVTRDSKVRVIRFVPYRWARELPENDFDGAVGGPRERRPLAIPAPLRMAHRFLPKLLVVDLSLYGDSIPFDHWEDLGKLMKAGVYVAFLSRKTPEEVERMMTAGLTPRQREEAVRYKLVVLADDGHSLAAYNGSFAEALPAPRFEPLELEMIEHAARVNGADVLARSASRLEAAGRPGGDAAALAAGMRRSLKGLGFDASRYALTMEDRNGRPTAVARPTTLERSMDRLLAAMRDEHGLYVNPDDMMVVSRDPDILKAAKGSVRASAHAPEAEYAGEDLVELSLAALLGPYRRNEPGDLAASASKIASFERGYGDDGGGFTYSIFMFMGHVTHAAFNWAVWVYRNTGALPSAEETAAKAREVWDREYAKQTRSLLDGRSGRSLGGFMRVFEKRLRSMHATLADLLEGYPIVIGTELPNLHVIEQYRGQKYLHRDILRLIYDLVLARRTPEGLDLLILDFKSGETPTMQALAKDTQIQLYDMLSRAIWPALPLPYRGDGEALPIRSIEAGFIHQPAEYRPQLTRWDNRMPFSKTLRNVMNRMRGPAPSAKKAAKEAPAKRGKGKSPPKGRRAKKAKG